MVVTMPSVKERVRKTEKENVKKFKEELKKFNEPVENAHVDNELKESAVDFYSKLTPSQKRVFESN